ncbi:reverse transcriptase domain-containing protein [Tanacetum coccineum]
MEELHKPSLIGRGGPIASTTIQRTDFVLKSHMVQLLRQNCQFHGFKDEDASEHLDKYLSITQFMKKNGVSEDIINLNLFPFSLTHDAEIWFYHLKTHSIYTWEEMVSKFLSKYYPYSKALQLKKEILNFRNCPRSRYLKLGKGSSHVCGNDDEVYHETTTGVSSHYPETAFALSAQIESDEDESFEEENPKLNSLIREPSNTFLMGNEKIELNSHEDIYDLVPIPRVSEKPLDSLDPISETFDMTITNPLFDFDFEFILNFSNSSILILE